MVASLPSPIDYDLGNERRGAVEQCATLTAASVIGDRIEIAHVGDTRAWLVRDGSAERLTQDQTITARMVAAGEITEAEAAEHPKRETLFQCIGRKAGDALMVDVRRIAVEPGDRLVLATDGLAYAGPDELVEKLMSVAGSPEAIVDSLTSAALTAGGQDNVTVIVADIIV